jgi:hypothetical protein
MFSKLLLALMIALAAGLPARAQGPFRMGQEPMDELVREAFATPYAGALFKRFAATVRKNGDASCLQTKALDDAVLMARGRALLQLWRSDDESHGREFRSLRVSVGIVR